MEIRLPGPGGSNNRSSKKAKDIWIYQRTIPLDSGPNAEEEDDFITLSDKIDQYLLKLGYTNAYVLGIVINLMTVGKIRVDFRAFSERLELKEQNDKVSRTAAVMIFDEHIANSPHIPKNNQQDLTGRIIVQSRERSKSSEDKA